MVERPGRPPGPGARKGRWSFLSHHAHVLLLLVRDPRTRVRELADGVGLSERAIQHILSDLEGAELLERRRDGRRNTYHLRLDRPLRHPLVSGCRLHDLVQTLLGARPSTDGQVPTNGPPRNTNRDRQSDAAPPTGDDRGKE